MRSYGSSIDSVIRALKAGHDAIVVVNSCRLPGNSEEEIAYHAAVVLDVNEEEVTLYDPATGEESTAYPKDHFIAAWNDAKAYLARVKVPDLDYNPRPIDLEDVELSTDLIELREALLKMRTKSGPTSARKRDGLMDRRGMTRRKRLRTWCLIPCFLIRKKNMIDVWRLIRSS